MSGGQSSFKVQYDLRPCKQIERRMMLHALQGLLELGFPISSYRYTGFGSLFFVDFVLFRKMLGIYDMQSVEINESLESRVRFNVPYGDIDIEIGDIIEYIPRLSPEKKHLLWLDYDDVFQEYMIDHLSESIKTLSNGSILSITVDVEYSTLPDATNSGWRSHIDEEAGIYVPPNFNSSDCSDENLPGTIVKIIENVIQKELAYQGDKEFQPLFNFVYADGHKMLTYGGMICGAEDKKKFNNFDWDNFYFLRNTFNSSPYVIRIPNLTRKEKLYLDSNMPADSGWSPENFDLTREYLDEYRKVYKYSPLYGELLL